jgi:hypothetical protein
MKPEINIVARQLITQPPPTFPNERFGAYPAVPASTYQLPNPPGTSFLRHLYPQPSKLTFSTDSN